MATISELLARAAALRDETAINSIDPNRAGGIMYDTLVCLNTLWVASGSSLVISKIYASVAAMQADTAPVSDLTGKALRPGQIVVIASSDADNGSVYRYDGPSSWSAVGKIGNLPVIDSLDSDSATTPLAAHQGKVLDGKISQLGQKVDGFVEEVDSDEYSEVLIDSEGKLLESRDVTGKKTINTDVDFKGQVTGDFLPEIEIKPGTEFVDAVIDSTNKTVEGTRKNGAKVFFGGVETEDKVPFKTSILYGKKWAVLGDSFTNGGGDNTPLAGGKYKGKLTVYPYIIGNRTGIDVLKFFEGGQTLAFPAEPGSFTNSVTNPSNSRYYQNIPDDVDYITIYLGINDEGHASGEGGDEEDYTGVIPLGTPSDNTVNTYYGAWNVVLSWLRENRPFAHIGIIVCNGLSSSDYMDAQIAMAKKYGFPYLNLNGDERCPAMIRTCNPLIPASVKDMIKRKQAVDYDGTQTGTVNTHPNQATHIYESTFIENFLKSL